MIGSSTASSLAANASGGMGGTGGSGSQQLGTRQDNVSMGSSGQSYELIKSTQVRPIKTSYRYVYYFISFNMAIRQKYN